MARPQNAKLPASRLVQRGAGNPVDYLVDGDLWQLDPSWRASDDLANPEWLSIAQVQWRAVQAVLAAHGRRWGAGTWLAVKVDDPVGVLQSKLKGSHWLQPHDLTLWAQVVPSLDVSTVVGDDPNLPKKWRALGQRESGFAHTNGPSLLPRDWTDTLARLGAWLERRTAPVLLDAGALRLGLAESLVAENVPMSWLVPHQVAAVPTVLGARWASRLELVGIVNLLPAEHDAARWPSAIRDLHHALLSLSVEPSDEGCLLVILGEAMLHQLPWLPSPALQQVLPARLAVADEEMERLDVKREEIKGLDLLARSGDAQKGHLLMCRLAALSS
jgi:hypothetical protein